MLLATMFPAKTIDFGAPFIAESGAEKDHPTGAACIA
jgi:hypothetical protein